MNKRQRKKHEKKRITGLGFPYPVKDPYDIREGDIVEVVFNTLSGFKEGTIATVVGIQFYGVAEILPINEPEYEFFKTRSHRITDLEKLKDGGK